MIHIRNGIDLELKFLGQTNTENLVQKFAGRQPNFSRDMREIISRKNCNRFPGTYLASQLYGWVERYLKSTGLKIKELYLLSAIGTMSDLYRETDCFFYLKIEEGREAVVTIDLFFIDSIELVLLQDFWIESFPGMNYSQEDFQTDLQRHSRMVSEVMKGRTHIQRWYENELPRLSKNEAYQRLWKSGYLPQSDVIARDPERGEIGYLNHLVVTPYHAVNPWARKVLASLIARILTRQLTVEEYSLAS